MANPWKDISLEQARQWESSQLGGVEGFRLRLKRAALWDILQQNLPGAGARVLDLGAGTGIWSIRLAAEGYGVVLTDVSEAMLEQARRNVEGAGLAGPIVVEQVDMVDLGRYEDAAFAMVLAVGAPLSYTSDPARAVAEVFRVSQPGGVFIGDAENRYLGALFRRRAADWADARRILLEGVGRWRDPGPATSIRMFTPPEVREMLEAAGWQVQGMYASDMVESLVHEEIVQELASQPQRFAEVLAVEKHLRSEPYLLASGRDIQFVARKG
jgi:ubiquinone/menaquinone biosynthesis C-methylase UbiE